MEDKPRYSVRRNSVALSRAQWAVVAAALAVAVAGLIITFVTQTSIGVMITSVATLAVIFILVFARARP